MTYYISHHGIEGQKWGVRNGPPYPLDYNDHTKAEQKHMRKDAARLTKELNKADSARAYAMRDVTEKGRAISRRDAKIKKLRSDNNRVKAYKESIKESKALLRSGKGLMSKDGREVYLNNDDVKKMLANEQANLAKYQAKREAKASKLESKNEKDRSKYEEASKKANKEVEKINALMKEVGDKGYYSSKIATERNVTRGKDVAINFAAATISTLAGSPIVTLYTPTIEGTSYRVKAGDVNGKRAHETHKAYNNVATHRSPYQVNDEDLGINRKKK